MKEKKILEKTKTEEKSIAQENIQIKKRFQKQQIKKILS